MTANISHRKSCFCVALALVAFLATSFALHALLPPAIPQGVAEKLNFFAQHKDEFDTLFVGTSRFYYAISPEIFDRITRENGMPTRTFNFGIDGMHPPENFYVLDQILKAKPRNLKWVFVELGKIQPPSTSELLGTQRLLYWHDWPRTALMLEHEIDAGRRAMWLQKLIHLGIAWRQVTLHLALFAKQFASVGRAANFVFSQNHVAPRGLNAELGPHGDGYRLAGAAMSPERAENYRQKLAEEVLAARPGFVDPITDLAYRDGAAKIRRAGAAPIFVVTPIISQAPLRFRKSPPAPLLLFNDCKTYPQLFDPNVRVDESHLTSEGAAEFTRLLALDLVDYTRRR